MPAMEMEHLEDPKQILLNAFGDGLNQLSVFNNRLIVAVYLRPEKTKSGLYLPDMHREEDKYQSKVGLVVKMGPDAFVDNTGEWFKGVDVKVGDWVYYRPSDGFNLTINKVLCRMLEDTSIRGVISDPDQVW